MEQASHISTPLDTSFIGVEYLVDDIYYAKYGSMSRIAFARVPVWAIGLITLTARIYAKDKHYRQRVRIPEFNPRLSSYELAASLANKYMEHTEENPPYIHITFPASRRAFTIHLQHNSLMSLCKSNVGPWDDFLFQIMLKEEWMPHYRHGYYNRATVYRNAITNEYLETKWSYV
jgi:hypothetical protein